MDGTPIFEHRGETCVKVVKRVLAALCVFAMLLPMAAIADDSFSMAHDGFSTSYTYNYDYWGDVQMSPDAYRVSAVIDSTTLGLENLGGKRLMKPQGLFVRDQDLYIADTGNNRIVQVHFDGRDFAFVRAISEISGCENNTFNSPYDVFVDQEYNIYVADYGNFRVVMFDKDLNWLKEP